MGNRNVLQLSIYADVPYQYFAVDLPSIRKSEPVR